MTSLTVPAADAWIGTETKPSASAILSPRSTRSPTFHEQFRRPARVLPQRKDDLLRERHPPHRHLLREVTLVSGGCTPCRNVLDRSEHVAPLSRRDSRSLQLNGFARSIHFSRFFSFG